LRRPKLRTVPIAAVVGAVAVVVAADAIVTVIVPPIIADDFVTRIDREVLYG